MIEPVARYTKLMARKKSDGSPDFSQSVYNAIMGDPQLVDDARKRHKVAIEVCSCTKNSSMPRTQFPN